MNKTNFLQELELTGLEEDTILDIRALVADLPEEFSEDDIAMIEGELQMMELSELEIAQALDQVVEAIDDYEEKIVSNFEDDTVATLKNLSTTANNMNEQLSAFE